MQKYELGLNKKSFSLFFNNGEIWCEHLDALYDKQEFVINKFKNDIITIAKPSTSAYIAINFDETIVNKELMNYILTLLNSANKSLRKVAFVGLNCEMKKLVKKANVKFEKKCIDDFEKAKEWLI